MPISIQQLESLAEIDTVIIHSLTPMLYQGTALIDGQELLVTDSQGKALKSFNLMEIQVMLARLPLNHLWLRHQSAYDEMIGQTVRETSNQLQVRLSLPNQQGSVENHTSIRQDKTH